METTCAENAAEEVEGSHCKQPQPPTGLPDQPKHELDSLSVKQEHEDTNFLVDGDYELFFGGDANNTPSFLANSQPVFSQELERGMQLKEETRLEGHTSKISCSCFSFDGSLFATAGYDKKIMIWSTANRNNIFTQEAHSFVITDVRFSSKQNVLASASLDKTICIWDCEEFCIKAKLSATAAVHSVDFSPIDPDVLCSADAEGFLKLWKIVRGDYKSIVTATLKDPSSCSFKQVRFHPVNGRLIAASIENTVNIYEVGAGGLSLVCGLRGHDKVVNTVSWSPSGDFLLTASEDSVRVWDSSSAAAGATYKCLKVLSSPSKFNCCAFHPRMSSVVVIGSYQTLCLWNVDMDRSTSFTAHDGIVSSISSSPPAGLLVSTSHDAKIKIWS